MSAHRRLLVVILLFFAAVAAAEERTATFAGGCFWCVEEAFDQVPGVISTVSGYANGRIRSPTYAQVSAGGTGHAEALQLRFDPERVSYEHLLEVFWRNHDPTDGDGQFCDRGDQYRPAIFYADEAQREAALASREALAARKGFPEPIVTAIEPLKAFYPAEGDHQDYHRRNPLRYTLYKYGCGRPARLEELWGEE